jgi:hypothetical protein
LVLVEEGYSVVTPVFFLDRDPFLFRYIINYIRDLSSSDSTSNTPNTTTNGFTFASFVNTCLDPYTKFLLKKEFEFFGLIFPSQ